MTSTCPLPVSLDEASALDSAIDTMAMRYRKRGVMASNPTRVNDESEVRGIIDSIIADVFGELQSNISADVLEKLYDRLFAKSMEKDDGIFSLNTLAVRLMDTMMYVISVKGSYRGVPRKAKYDRKFAIEQLTSRGLIRRK